MNLGKRIDQRLKDLGWERKDLLARVPDLTPQALSNLITRDSKRSEWDEAIADALGVEICWLVYGKNSMSVIGNDAIANPATRAAVEVLLLPRIERDALQVDGLQFAIRELERTAEAALAERKTTTAAA